MLTITAGGDMNGGGIKIINLNGQVMASREIHSEKRFNLTMRSFLSGAYVVLMADKNRSVRYCKRIIR
jgi:hypothetical protein